MTDKVMQTAEELIKNCSCVAVSACLLGQNCKYSGGNNLNTKLVALLGDRKVIPVCPEIMGGLKTPRKPCEIKNGQVINTNGEDVTKFFEKGAKSALKKVIESKAELAVLQSRSPSCGAKQIYDGSFSGRLIQGKGLFAQELERNAIKTVDVEDLQSNGIQKKKL